MRVVMKLGIANSVFIIVAIASANCEAENPYPDVIAEWPNAGNVTIKHGCKTTTRTTELEKRYPHCVYYCKINSTWHYGFYHHATKCEDRGISVLEVQNIQVKLYGKEKLPGVCILGLCYLETETVTDATSPDSTQTPPVENVTTPLPPVENETAPTQPVEN